MDKMKKKTSLEALQSKKKVRVGLFIVGILIILSVGILADWSSNAIKYTGWENGAVNDTSLTGITWILESGSSANINVNTTAPVLNGSYSLKINGGGTRTGLGNRTGEANKFTNNTISIWINSNKTGNTGYTELYSGGDRNGTYIAYTFQQSVDCPALRICTTDGGSWEQSAYNYIPNTWQRQIIIVNSSGTWFFYNNQSGFVRFVSGVTSIGTWTLQSVQGAFDNIAVCQGNDFDCGISTAGAPSISVTLNSPANNFQTNTEPVTFIANVTPNTYNLTNATLNVWFSNGTLFSSAINTSLSGNQSQNISFNISNFILGNYVWNINAVQGNGNGTNSSSATNNFTFTWGIEILGEEYNTPVLEQSFQTFKINVSTPSFAISTIILRYNNTNYAGTFTNINSTAIAVSSSLITPNVSANKNISFFWNITFINSPSILTTLTRNQTVLNFGIDNCSTNTVQIFNFTIVNEESQTPLSGSLDNTSIKVDIDLFTSPNLTKPSFEFFSFYNKTNPSRVCINNEITNTTFFMNALVEYDADNYANEFYNIQNYSLNTSSGNSQNITLYDLLDTSSQSFKINYKDSSFLSVSDALIQIQRKYVNEGIFKTVEIPKTDTNGDTIGHLVVNNVIYSFTIVKNGRILSTFDNVYAVCQNPLIQTCEINLNAFSSTISITNFSAISDFLYTLTYDENTRTILSSFSIPSGAVALISLNVSSEDALGTSLCSSQVTTSAGSVSCIVPSNFGNGTTRAELYKNNVLVGFGNLNLSDNPHQTYSGVLIILILFIFLTLIGAGMSDNPVVTIFFFMVGVILLIALNIVKSSGFIGGQATILFLIVAIIIVVIKAGRRT